MDGHPTARSDKDENCHFKMTKMLGDKRVEPCRVHS
jgi:hypothetical protein